MNRGYLTGGLCGLVVSAVGLGTASLLAEQPAGNTPPQQPVVESPDLTSETAGADTAEVLPEVSDATGGAPAPSDSPEVTQPDEGTSVSQAETTTPEQPLAGAVTSVLEAPEVNGDPGLSVGSDEPLAANEGVDAPAVPEGEADIVLETTTPEPPVVEPDVVVVDDAPVEEAAVEDDPVVVIVEDEAPEAEMAEEVVVVVEEPEAEEQVAMVDTGNGEGISDAPVMEAPVVDETLPETPSTDEDAGSLISLQGDEAALPGEGSVRIVEEDAPVEETEEAAAAPAREVVEGEALASFASAFENADNQPVMTVVLVDDGSLDGAEAALGELDFPFSVALDPAMAGAGDKMAVYRAAGIEVIAMAEVPAGAQPSDAEIALEAGFAALPEAIGLLDIGQAGLQTDRALAVQAMARLAEDGRGFVTLSQGLNSGLRAASDADVPVATVYRDLDDNDQDARVIRRFLDQAAFRARQQGEVVLVGRVRADTISALVLWNTANAGGEVILAPVSAVLMGQ